MRQVVIEIPGDPGLLNPNRRISWRARQRLTKAIRTTCYFAWHDAGRPCVGNAGKATVRIVVFRGRVMDHDNMMASLKPYLDGLFARRTTKTWAAKITSRGLVTADDSLRHLRVESLDQVTGQAAGRQPRVVFTIELEEAAGAEQNHP